MKIYDTITVIFDFYKKIDMCKIEYLEKELGINIPRNGDEYVIDITDEKQKGYVYEALKNNEIEVSQYYDEIVFKVEV